MDNKYVGSDFDDWIKEEGFLDLPDETMDQAEPIPQSLFEKMKHIRELAEINKKREKLEAASKAYAQAKREGTIKTLDIPVRDKEQTVAAHPVDGDYETQLNNAFAIAFERYERALEELAKK